MARLLDDWIATFLDYTDHMEAPRIMRSWGAISTIASVLRKRVWIDQDQFVWTPSLYIIIVGPPGVLTKSTTTDMGSYLLRQIPGIKFGPNNITWQALAGAFVSAGESFEWPLGSGDWIPMSPLTLVSRELGSLLNPKDGDLVNLFIELYDGAHVYEKVTKMSGNDTIESPWINMIGATTPSWIAENVPKSALGGGLISRIIFLYGDEKEKLVAYPKKAIKNKAAHKTVQEALIHDLEHIATNMLGPFELTPEAEAWGEQWYEKLWKGAKEHYSDDKLMGYIARKQTHLHKVAMVLSASYKDKLELTLEDLQLADQMLTSIEGCLDKVFAQIGRSEIADNAEKMIQFVEKKGKVSYEEVYRFVYSHFPNFHDWEGVYNGAIRAERLFLVNTTAGAYLTTQRPGRPLPPVNSGPQPLPGPDTNVEKNNS